MHRPSDTYSGTVHEEFLSRTWNLAQQIHGFRGHCLGDMYQEMLMPHEIQRPYL